jgi:hypothetical protein
MVERFKNKQDILAIKWDNKDETIECIKNEICSLIKGCAVGRCYNEMTDKNDLDSLCVSFISYPVTINQLYEVGEYVVMDLSKEMRPILRYSEKDLNKAYYKIEDR